MVFMVLSGHFHTEHAFVSRDAAGLPVFQMVADYQDRDFGGNGLMRLVTIDPLANTIGVRTFSPHHQTDQGEGAPSVDTNYFETDRDSQFEYRVNVKERLLLLNEEAGFAPGLSLDIATGGVPRQSRAPTFSAVWGAASLASSSASPPRLRRLL